MTAEGRQTGDNMIARLHVGHDFLENARRFIPKHDRQPVRIKSFNKVKIAVTDSRHRRPDQDFPRPEFIDRNVFDDERLSHFMQYCGFHSSSPCSV